MDHHGTDLCDLAEAMPDDLGTTGRYPGGKLTEDDLGEIRVGLNAKDGNVILGFGKSVEWVAMTPTQALRVAMALKRYAKDARKMRGGQLGPREKGRVERFHREQKMLADLRAKTEDAGE